MPAMMSTPELAEVLFASPLQQSDRPSPDDVRATVERMLAQHHDRADCACYVAQEAGDHPDTYVTRMRWALRTARDAYAVAA